MNNLHSKYTAKDLMFINPSDKEPHHVFCYFLVGMGKGNKPKQNAMFYYSPGNLNIKLAYLTNTDLRLIKMRPETWRKEALEHLFAVLFKDRKAGSGMDILQFLELIKTDGKSVNPFKK